MSRLARDIQGQNIVCLVWRDSNYSRSIRIGTKVSKNDFEDFLAPRA
jgi:hypothetical protein